MVVRLVASSIGGIVAVLAVGTIFPGDFVTYQDDTSVVIFGVVQGVLMTFVKPIVRVLTLPVSCLTFGAFSLVINAVLFWVSARLTPDLEVGYAGALLGGIFVAIINGVIYSVVDQK